MGRNDKMSMLEEKILHIPIENIRPNPYQPRKIFNKSALDELSESIKAYGVIQPISVRRISENNFELVAGERRLRATELAKLNSIPAIIVNMRDQDSAVIALVENLQREDLNFIEEAEGYNSLIKDHGLTQQDLAQMISKNQSTIANKLRILRLSEEIKKLLLKNSLTERHARALLKLPDQELQIEVLEKIIKNDLTVKRTELLIKSMLEDLTKEDVPKGKQSVKALINLKIYLNTLRDTYNTIKNSGIEAKYEEKDKGDYVEVVVRLPKNNK